MLYSLAIEPLIHRLRMHLSGLLFPGCKKVFKLSAYADGIAVLVNEQNDINILVKTVSNFGKISFAKVNWGKVKKRTLPGGLVWNRGGFKYRRNLSWR